MKVIDKENIAIEIYERGAGYTLASGTGACAATAVAHKPSMTNNKVIVHMPGESLQVEVENDETVFMREMYSCWQRLRSAVKFTREFKPVRRRDMSLKFVFGPSGSGKSVSII